MKVLVAANYQSQSSASYGFMSTTGIKLKNNTKYTIKARYKWDKNDSAATNPMVAYLYDTDWKEPSGSGNAVGSFSTTSGHDVMKTEIRTFTTSSTAATRTWEIWCYARNKNSIAAGAILSVDWYELWEGDATTFSLTDAIALSNNKSEDDFLAIQNGCQNTGYFSTSEPINALRSWMGYYYKIGGFLHSASLSTSSVGAGGGTITISYNIKDDWSNGKKTNLSGVKPTITTTLGSIGSISSTDSNGNGSVVLTVSSRGTTPGSALTGTITISYGGVTKTLPFTQALNQVESIRVKATFNLSKYTATAGKNTITAAGTGGAYLKFTSGVETEIVDSTSNTSKYGGTIAFTRTYTTSGTGFSNDSKTITVASRGTTIGAARTGTVTSNLTAVFTRTTPTSGTVTGSATYTRNIEQEANNVTAIEAVVSNTNTSSCHWYYEKGSKVANALSKDGESITPVVNGACIFTFTSGEKSDKTGAAGNYQGKTLSFNRTYSGSATGFTVNTSTGVVTAAKNTTVTSRSISVNSSLTVTWGSLTHTLTQSRTVYQAAGDKMTIYVKGLNNTVEQYLDFSTGYVEIKYYNDSTTYTNNIGFSGQFSTNSTYTYIVSPDHLFGIFRDTGVVPQNITISFNNANFYNNVNYNSYNGCDMSIEFYSPSKGSIYTTSSQNISTNSNPLHGRNVSKTFTVPSNMNYDYIFPNDTTMNIRLRFYNA